MKNRLLSLIGFALLTGAASAQVDVTASGGTASASYSTLKGAFDAINAGTHTGSIGIGLSADSTETATAALNASGAGSASYTTITISPTGGAARTISGAITAGSPLLDLVGADNVTIDGLNTGGNSLTIANTTASNTAGTSTVRFIGGATNNTITNCNLQGSVSSSVATAGAVVFFSTDAVTANGNDNNTISNCNIGPAGANLPTKAIQGNGSTTTTAIGNSGIVIDNNNIFDYFGAATTSSGVATTGGCNTWSITNNRFYQTGTRTWTTGSAHRAIDIGPTTATSGAQGFTITGNIVGYASSTQTGTYTLTGAGAAAKFAGIVYNGITGAAVTNINNNTVAAVSLTGVTSSGTSSSSPFLPIMAQGGPVISNNNTIGSQSATGSLTFSTTTSTATDTYGILNFSVDDWTSNSNTVGGISVTNAGASGTFVIYGLRANTNSAKVWNATSNLVGGTVADSIQLSATGAASQVIGMSDGSPAARLTANTVRNLTTNIGTGTTTGASVIGISITATTPSHTLSQNTIFNLTNTHATTASALTGLQFNGGGANVVERNSISRLSVATTSATAEVNGIRIAGGTTVYRNNMIALGAGIANAIGATAANASSTGINGINEAAGTNSFFHNSVYLGGSPTAGSGASYAFNNGAVLTATRSVRDNIFFNARSNGGATGKHYAVKLNGTAANPTGLTINNNLYFANGSGAVFGFFNSLDVASLVAWAAAVGQDVNSLESNPQFVDPTHAAPDLHLNPAVLTPAEGNGSSVGVTDDFDGQTRSDLTPTDIGADAGNFLLLDIISPAISFTPIVKTASTASYVLTVTITDATAVATGAVGPRIYFNKNGGAYFSTAATLTGGTVQNGIWNFTIDPSLLGGVALTDTISYFVVAQDTLGNVGSSSRAGFVGTDVNTVTTPPTTPTQYVIVPALSGTRNVGSAETITSLTNTGGLFDTINNSEVTGDLAVNLTSDLTGELGTVALNEMAGGFGLLIRPSGASRTITGSSATALIRLNDADNVTLDGSTTGASAPAGVGGSPAIRELTIVNTNTGTSAVVLAVSGVVNGAQNNTFKNLNLIGNDPTTTLVGVAFGGATPGSAGPNNRNNRIENCTIQKTIYGIYSSGVSAVAPTTGTVILRNDFSATGASRIRRVGILIFNDDGAQITENSVGGIDTNENADAIGIGVGMQGMDATTVTSGGVINAMVSGNKINGIAQNSATGFSAAGIAVAGGAGVNTIAGNMIFGVISPATSPDLIAGIFVAGTAGSTTRVYFNSISLTGNRGTVATQTPSFGIAITGTDPTVDVRNNIFANIQDPGSGGANALSFAIGTVGTTFANLTSDRNLFYAAGPNPGYFRTGSLAAGAGTNYAALAAWQAATGKDANSLFADPLFTSATDLHITNSSPAWQAGVSIAGITTDIDGDTIGATPNLGADGAAVPTVTTPTSASIAGSSATLGGDVTSEGASSVTTRGVVYALTSDNASPRLAGTGVTNLTAAGTTGVFTVNATGLTAGAAYSFAAYATNSYGTGYSAVDTFTTAVAPPTVTAISPTSGTTAGGTSVTITGTNFTGATGVTIGGTAATSVNITDDTTLTCVTPAHAVGTASVLVTTPSGTNSANTLYTYISPDSTPPTVVSIVRQSPGTQTTNSASVTFRVTFSEPVHTPATTNFAVAPVGSGTVAGTVDSVTSFGGSTSIYDVAVTITSGSGEFRLKVKD